MDVQMPGLNGYDTTEELRRRAPTLPVIGLTARALPEERARCLACGMADHVSKPINFGALVEAIQAVVERTVPADPLPA